MNFCFRNLRPELCKLSVKMTEDVDVFINPFAAGVRSNADVIMIVEEWELHLHSQILSDGSPVFKTMLDVNFVEGISKRVELKNKKARYVIEFLKFFYPSLGATVNDAATNISVY
ncbi:uncharacterized protein LOC130623004 isoform X2 [Hydractinia symbiolongicarpus]|uniref:uncharacterized protein LOC130623004 isoform X2 n=1 Tax=Hydractinia symbiolongicarpus TaxID=13093 RepID=UPI00254A5FCE|nr:uncharacterized protein LOC130623004 isoform X2 [Hydractinia symbiolongicarpus]